MTRRVFVDSKWSSKKNKNSKKYACYDQINDLFFEVDSLAELKEYDEIYLDSSIFPNMWQQLKELVSNGRRVYYFSRPWQWKKIRQRFREDLKAKTGRISKTDRGDAFLLSKVYELSLIKNNTHRYFRLLTIVDVELRPLLMKEELLYKNLQRVQRASMIGVDIGSNVKTLEKMVEDVRREIIDKAARLIQGFMDTAKCLRLNVDDVNGLVGLAGLLTYIKSTSYQKSVKYLGLCKAKGRDAWKIKKYSSKAQRYLTMLTNTILWKDGEIRPPTFKDLRRVLKMVIDSMKQMKFAEGAGVSALARPAR